MLIIFVLCFSTDLFAVKIYLPNYKVADYNIEANVKDDGSIDVVEYLKYHFNGSMNGVYRNILYKYTFLGQKNDMKATSSRYQASGIDNIKVYTSNVSFENMTVANEQLESTLSNGMNNVYSVLSNIKNGYRKNIKVYSPVIGGDYKYVKYEYTIKDVIVYYNNSAEFYWNFVGGDWECGIDSLDITVNFLNFEGIQAFGHTFANVDEINTLGKTTNMKFSNISAGTAVDIRAVFSNKFMNNIKKTINENYDFNALNSIENQMAIDRKKYLENLDLSNKIWIFYIAFIIITYIYIHNILSKSKNKSLKKLKKVEHYPNLPDTYSLGDYNCIRDIKCGFADPNLVIATILDLSNRKYIKLESLKKAKLFKETYEYYASIDISKDLNELNDYEKHLLNYIFNKKVGNDSDDTEDIEDVFELKSRYKIALNYILKKKIYIGSNIDVTKFTDERIELNERFKELGKDYMLGVKYRKTCTGTTSLNAKKMYKKFPKKIWIIYIISFLILFTTATLNISTIYPGMYKYSIYMFIIGVTSVIYFFAGININYSPKNLKDDYADEYNKLLGLQKYLIEYSLIKERLPIEIVLWGKYLVYAALFGIADKVSKEFKEELLKLGYDENYIYTTYPSINMGIYSQEITKSAVSMSGSSTSGGFRAGGGGGGGGRRWRWWRCLLVCEKNR